MSISFSNGMASRLILPDMQSNAKFARSVSLSYPPASDAGLLFIGLSIMCI